MGLSMHLATIFDAQTMWYVTRATGVVALALLTLSVLIGVVEAVRWTTWRWPRFVTAGVHRNISLLATAFVVAHLATSILDGFAPIGWIDAVVPFHSPYRPIWLGLGTVAFDLLLALAVTSLLRNRIGHRGWRIVHWAAYACWPIALVHGIGTGTDTRTTVLFDVEIVCAGIVVLAVWWRAAAGWPERAAQRIFAGVMGLLVPLAIGAWAYAGPLQVGWARRAGTPDSLLGGAAAQTDGTAAPADGGTAPAPAPTPAAFAAPFDSSLDGTVAETEAGRRDEETITIDANLTGGAAGSLHVELNGRAIDDGGVSLESSTVQLTEADNGDTYTGSVTDLQGNVVDVHLQSPTGAVLSLELQLQIDDGRVTGTAHGEPQ